MNLFARVAGFFRAVWSYYASGDYRLSDSRMAKIFGVGQTTAAGIDVDEMKSLSMTAVWSAVRFLSETMGSLPLKVYRKRTTGGRDEASDHPVYALLHDTPNPEMTAMVFRETLQGHVLLWGNAYAEIQRDGTGAPVALWPVDPSTVKPRRDAGGNLYYEVNSGGQTDYIEAEDMLHVPGLGFDGVTGYSVIRTHANAVGLALAMEATGGAFFKNNGIPSGILFNKGITTKEVRDENRKNWQQKHGQGGNSERGTAVLFGEWDFKPMSMPFEDAEFIAGRQMQVTEVARIFRVAPHILYDLERSTNNNIEHQGIELVVYTVRPWCVRWEQECNRKLFRPEERGTFFVEHVIDGLLRGDAAARNNAFATQRQNGIINADEWRAMENMNPIADGTGQIYMVNTAMQPVAKPKPDVDPLAITDATASAPEGSDVQATALNGAQIASLLTISQEVVASRLPGDGAKEMLAMSFPGVTVAQLAALVSALEAFKGKAAPEPAPTPFGPPKQDDAPPADDAQARRAAQAEANRAVILDTLGRLTRRETSAARRAAKAPDKFLDRIDTYYADAEPFMAQALGAHAAMHLIAIDYQGPPAVVIAEKLAADWCAASKAELLEVSGTVGPKDLPAAIEALCVRWETERPAELADALKEKEMANAT